MNILHNQKLHIRRFLKNDSVVSYILTKELAQSILLSGKKDHKTANMSPLVLEKTLPVCKELTGAVLVPYLPSSRL